LAATSAAARPADTGRAATAWAATELPQPPPFRSGDRRRASANARRARRSASTATGVLVLGARLGYLPPARVRLRCRRGRGWAVAHIGLQVWLDQRRARRCPHRRAAASVSDPRGRRDRGRPERRSSLVNPAASAAPEDVACGCRCCCFGRGFGDRSVPILSSRTVQGLQ
jgi:hypothetical protein